MHPLDDLLEKNRKWAQAIRERDPDFFPKLSRQQAPTYLWIGCSDSRVPANEIVDLLPGELFVHRNVANIVVHTDLNCLSVIQFAVDILKVKHVIVVGHYGCGGIRCALSRQRVGLSDNWLRHVHDVHKKHAEQLARREDPSWQLDRLCELNVLEQVINVCQTTIVQDAWQRGADLTVHGWVYSLADGLIRDLSLHIASLEEEAPVYAKVRDRLYKL